jgi:hypothetical protein
MLSWAPRLQEAEQPMPGFYAPSVPPRLCFIKVVTRRLPPSRHWSVDESLDDADNAGMEAIE